MRKILALFLALLLLCGCSATPPATEPPETTAAPVTELVTEPPTEPATVPPTTLPPETNQPIPVWEVLQTPESTCFTVVSYCPEEALLRVQFRNSGEWYVYYDVEPELWSAFKRADSKGGFFNDFVKGFYDYARE